MLVSDNFPLRGIFTVDTEDPTFPLSGSLTDNQTDLYVLKRCPRFDFVTIRVIILKFAFKSKLGSGSALYWK